MGQRINVKDADCGVKCQLPESPGSTLNTLPPFSGGTTPGCASPLRRALSGSLNTALDDSSSPSDAESNAHVGLAAIAAAATARALQQQQQQAIATAVSNLQRLALERGVELPAELREVPLDVKSSVCSAKVTVDVVHELPGEDTEEFAALRRVLAGLDI